MKHNRWRNYLIAAAASLASTTPALAGDESDDIVSREVLVRLHTGVPVETLIARHPGLIDHVERSISGRNTHLLILTTAGGEAQFSQLVESQDGDIVIWVEANYEGRAPEGTARQFYFNETGVPITYTTQPTWLQIGLNGAHNYVRGGGTTIAIIDSGVDAAHPALAGRIATGGWDFIDNDADPSPEFPGQDNDQDGYIDEGAAHGTHIAGLAAYVAPEALLLPIRALDPEGISDNFIVAEAIYYAIDQGVDVINLSLGSTYRQEMVEDAVDEAISRGIVVVAAAGNLGINEPVQYPAFFDGVIRVTSVNSNDQRASWANYHPQMTIAAPGVELISSVPGDLYASWNGTSMSTAVVSGGAALVLARHADWPLNSGRVASATGFLTATAVNIDAQNPAFAGQLGAGRLDVAAAVQNAVMFRPTDEMPTGLSPLGISSGDLNGDGRADAVIANSGSNSVSILLSNVNGSFTALPAVPAAGGPEAVALADFNNDGALDALIGTAAPSGVHVLVGANDGTLTPHSFIALGGGISAIAAQALDGGDLVDFAAASGDGSQVFLCRNLGGFAFQSMGAIVVGNRPVDLIAAQLDGQGGIDLATANRRSSDVAICRNLGNWQFSVTNVPLSGEPREISAGDLDGDGDVDLISGDHDSSTLSILTNNGAGSFAVTSQLGGFAPMQPADVIAADVNCDARTDIIATTSDDVGGAVRIYLQSDAGTFGGAFVVPLAPTASHISALDADHDGDADLIITGGTPNHASLLTNLSCVLELPGDMNCDGRVNNFDINPFVMAISDPTAYEVEYPNCSVLRADINGDGLVNNFDIAPFVACVENGGC
ncbi:MAG: S8 family serine peptidase [Phycisphaerales bacterium]|nr:S8 family serine peptidase [Phycisphaerales bacterium]